MIAIEPAPEPVDAHVSPPGSKSLTNRALLVAALADGASVLEGALFSDDTVAMAAALRALGVEVEEDAVGRRFAVAGAGGSLRPGPAALDVREAGTAARFLPAALALGDGVYEVDGAARMRERPMAPLVAALRRLGVRVDGERLPLRVHGVRGRVAPVVEVDGSVSSQFTSGLLLSAPYFERGLELRAGALVSRPYVAMTLRVMADFGVDADADGERIVVPRGRYRARSYAVEPDATAASYFFAAAAVTGGRVVVDGLGRGSTQGDLGFVHVLEKMGCAVDVGGSATEVRGPTRLRGVEVDMRDISDTAPTLAAVAALADGPTRVVGIGFVRGKESDRIGDVVAELRRAGVDAEAEADGFVVRPAPLRPAVIDAHGDHRIAMSFALLGLRAPGIAVAGHGCVAKTFPDYFAVLARATGAVVREGPQGSLSATLTA